jgi:hypothetical protein
MAPLMALAGRLGAEKGGGGGGGGFVVTCEPWKGKGACGFLEGVLR